MKKKKITYFMFALCMIIFIGCGLLCLFNMDALRMEFFQDTISFSGPAVAKFEKDGNLYIVDSGSFRLICMAPDGNIHYTITIDKMKEYIRIVDFTIDERGNLYIYAMEAEYDANLTKRDIIRKYDNNGHFIKDIISINYNSAVNNPRLFYQFSSLLCENGILTFSRLERNRVTLYQYDTFREDLKQLIIPKWWGMGDNNLIAHLIHKDFNNYAYVMRDGDIFEVINSEEPLLRASFTWNEESGGIIPWYLRYDNDGNIIFFDMASGSLFRINGSYMYHIVPESYFEHLKRMGEFPAVKGFGFYENTYAGIYGDIVWMYDGSDFIIFDGPLQLPPAERFRIIVVQLSLVLGILAFISGFFILFVGILDRYVSLFIKQTAVIIPLLIMAFIILFSVTFNILTERHNETLFNELRALAVLSSKLINGDDIDMLKSTKDYYSDSYNNLVQTLKEITGNNADPWNKAFYSALFKGSHFEYALMVCTDEYNLFRPTTPLMGEEYDSLIKGEIVGGIFSLDDGDWAFAAVPVYNSAGNVNGVLEIGLDMIAYEISNVNLRKDVALIASGICLVILLVLCFLISIIVRQLSAVAGVLHAISGGDHTKRVRYKAKDELGKVSYGLNNMAEELQNQFNRINRLNESTIRFVPVQFMKHLGVSDISKMKLGDNVQRETSVLFFDIRTFSINSEMMTARENFIFINKVLGIAGPIIRRNNGFVDKYIGDAAMVLFDNGLDAVRSGIELQRELVFNSKTCVKLGVDSIAIGVGIHTGSVMMGIVGENERLSSTVISPNVNLASRVESLTKQTGSGLLITKDTLNQLAGSEGEFTYRFIGMVQAAGINEVIGLFDILDALPEKDKRKRIATKAIFESGVRNFHQKKYAKAVLRFERVIKEDPGDICAVYHLNEAKKRIKDPDLPSMFVFDKK